MSTTKIGVYRADQIRHVAELDATLFASAQTRALIEIGLDAAAEVTDRYGAPDRPRWASGTVESEVFMAYHCGGQDGHTSVGPRGDGVPWGVLLIADAVNAAAGREVIGAGLRAAAFTAACLHDHTQLCGRSLAPEGQGEGRGDERISAVTAVSRCLDAGISDDAAALVGMGMRATAFDPATKAQHVEYDGIPEDSVIVQELVACADLLSLTSRRGPLGSLEMIAEGLCLRSAGRLAQARLGARRPRDLGEFYAAAGLDAQLHAAVITALHSQSTFFSGFVFADRALRELTGGPGIDALFPGRGANAARLAAAAAELTDRTVTPAQVWEQIRADAGYPAPPDDEYEDDGLKDSF